MLARVLSGAVLGVNAVIVEVEVDTANGTPGIDIAGLTEGAARESRMRVEIALKNCGHALPGRRVTINLTPADIRKEGAAFDLPVAVALLEALGSIGQERQRGYLFAGELSLEGTLRPVRGVLPLAVAARDHGLAGVVVPRGNAREAAVVGGIEVRAVRHLREVVDFLRGECEPPCEPVDVRGLFQGAEDCGLDFSEVRGQEHVKRALEVAAAGAHNLLMLGPPGSGKTMLARRLPTILPPLSLAEAIETTKIHSVAGLLGENEALVTRRPFRSPHHTIGDAGLVGGGPVPVPGEASLAHNGVLFLDELPEFKMHVLEALCRPLEDRRVTIARASMTLTWPANFMLVGAMNPCPCGFGGDPQRNCPCSAAHIRRYRGRVGRPLLDRIDIHVEVPSAHHPASAPMRGSGGESSAAIRARVETAREVQRRRFVRLPRTCFNAQMGPRLLQAHCVLGTEGHALLSAVIDRLGMSARVHDRILRVARTIADLAGSEAIETPHLAEAIQYRATP